MFENEWSIHGNVSSQKYVNWFTVCYFSGIDDKEKIDYNMKPYLP